MIDLLLPKSRTVISK